MGDFTELLLIAAGLIAGAVDSIAGGGGLITVPLLTILMGPGSFAIGTNKVAAVAASFAALLIYLKGGHVSLKGHRLFAISTGLGALAGACVSPFVPALAYRWVLIAILPVMLWIVFRKDLWVRNELAIQAHPSESALGARARFWALGFTCGFYDGIAGPGGGTLMFLSLFLVARIPLLASMATAKVANLSSASLSLAMFSTSGHVVWNLGFWLALGISAGAVVGASFAAKRAASLARFALLIVSGLLLVRLVFG